MDRLRAEQGAATPAHLCFQNGRGNGGFVASRIGLSPGRALVVPPGAVSVWRLPCLSLLPRSGQFRTPTPGSRGGGGGGVKSRFRVLRAFVLSSLDPHESGVNSRAPFHRLRTSSSAPFPRGALP